MATHHVVFAAVPQCGTCGDTMLWLDHDNFPPRPWHTSWRARCDRCAVNVAVPLSWLECDVVA